MWVEIVPALEVCTDEENEVGIGVVGRGAVIAVPDAVPEAGPGGADIRMAVVPVHVPGLEDAVHIAFVAGAAHVIDHFVVPFFLQGFPDAGGDIVEGLVPGDAFPLSFAPFSAPFEGIEDAVGVGDLVDGSRPFRAVSPPARRMVGVAFEFADFTGFFVYERRQSTSGFAVEAGGGHDGIAFFGDFRPGFGFVLDPVVPFFRRGEAPELPFRHEPGLHGFFFGMQVGDEADFFSKALYPGMMLFMVHRGRIK